jgi:hypothetical protein
MVTILNCEVWPLLAIMKRRSKAKGEYMMKQRKMAESGGVVL